MTPCRGPSLITAFLICSLCTLPRSTHQSPTPSPLAERADPIILPNQDLGLPCPRPLLINGVLRPPFSLNTTTTPCQCPRPLISNPTLSLDLATCIGSCCLPCPTLYAFYSPTLLDRIFALIAYLRIASFFCIAVSAISYLILPGKRSHPAITALWLILAISLHEVVAFLWTSEAEKGMCANQVVDATMHNNGLCAVQGALAVFASHAVLYWGLIMILSLFLQTVRHSNFLECHYVKVFLLGWLIPLCFTLVPLAAGEIRFAWSNYCFVSPEVTSKYVFYPAAVLVAPSVVLGCWTFGHIFWIETTIKVTLRQSGDFAAFNHPEHKRDSSSSSDTSASASITMSRVEPPATATATLRRAVHHRFVAGFLIQWRAIALAIALVLANFVNWAFYLSESPKLASLRDPMSSPFQVFMLCLYDHQDQSLCASLISEAVPRLWLGALAESCVPLLGVVGFAVFTLKRDTPAEWRRAWNKWHRRRKSTILTRVESSMPQEETGAGIGGLVEMRGVDGIMPGRRGSEWGGGGFGGKVV